MRARLARGEASSRSGHHGTSLASLWVSPTQPPAWSSSSTDFTEGLEHLGYIWLPLSAPWALLSEIPLLFGSHTSGAGQNQRGNAFPILTKLRIWQLASCCRVWRTVSPSVGTSYPRPRPSPVAFFRRFPTAVCHHSILPRGLVAGFLCFPLPSSKSSTSQRANKIEVTGERVWNFEWFLLNTISLHCTVNETAKLQSLRRTMIDHGSEKQFSVP